VAGPGVIRVSLTRLASVAAALVIAAVLSGCVDDPNIPGHGPEGPIQPGPEPQRSARCEELRPSLGEPESSAGTTRVRLTVTNDKDETCVTRGYPTLALVGADGHTVGRPAAFERHLRPIDVELEAGGTAEALITIPVANGAKPGDCQGGVARMRILLPRAGGDTSVPFDHEYCPGWSVTRFE
jgi:hypothetical protein